MQRRPVSFERRAGFTLIEILAVILIIGILATILVTQLGGAEEAAKVQTTRQQLATLEGALNTYEIEFGDYPSSSFSDEQGVPNDGTNVGVECLVVALWSRGYEGGGFLDDIADQLINVDGDHSGKSLTDFGTRALLEIVDGWGNPIAYIHRRDYELTNRAYLTFNDVTGEEIRSFPKAFRDPLKDRFYNFMKFQLISAGPDGEFGGPDDITVFDRD
jgi:prepilin-type N-terminal cleavage/methylation domain-containing protein